MKEAEAKWKKKRDREGYTEQIPDSKPVLPMLAQKYRDHGHKIEYPCYVQPKLDGIRCFIHVDGENITLKSRKGKEFKSLGHIADAIRDLVSKMLYRRRSYKENGKATVDLGKSGSFILDGELYNHQMKDNFQGITSAVKRDEPNDISHMIQFHCYDYVSEDRDFEDRVQELFHMDQWLDSDTLQIVHTVQVNNLDGVVEQNAGWLEAGYEGSMIRNSKGGYKINGLINRCPFCRCMHTRT